MNPAMAILIGIALCSSPILLQWKKYGTLDPEDFERFLNSLSLQQWRVLEVTVAFGALLVMFGVYEKLAVWR